MKHPLQRIEYDALAVEEPERFILILRLNRPEAANAFNTAMGRELHDAFSRFVLDPGEVRCLILTGAGEKAFCAGGDLKERNGMTDEVWRAQHALFEQAYYRLMDCPIPAIAAVNGAAYGGGCELALACDFIYAADTARFALTEASLGIIPGCGGTQNLPRAVGPRRAKELILSARPFSAQQAFAWGMVNAVYEPGELMPGALAMARLIAANGPLAVRQAKRAIDLGMQTDRTTGLGIEVEAYNRLVPTEDRLEGVRAFNEKRKPQFRGR
jgi:enoyl-CoA hydratase